MAQVGSSHNLNDGRLNGQTIIDQLIRNMEIGRFEMAYSVLLPCIFDVYLHPDDHSRLSGVFDLIADDAKRALATRVGKLNRHPKVLGFKRGNKSGKEYKIAARDWIIEFFPDTEGSIPLGDVEIHSELNETAQPGYRGTKTTLFDREPSVTGMRPTGPRTSSAPKPAADRVYAEIRYEDDSGPQLYLVCQNQVRVGRGGDDVPMDLALYSNDEVSREHFLVRRDAATGQFYVTDRSTNGTWIEGRRLKKGVEEPLPERANIGVAEVLTLNFEVRR
ncbi:MAG TPA: FHA domain-containing protein [Chloroflexota bacterium]|nr:FHA domain-containing protein [Chloroflexota bacterium]